MSEPALAEPSLDVSAPRRFAPSPAAIAVIVFAVVLIATAAVGGLFEPTETRYAEIAREMDASGDWLVPRLNGIPHLHKPPLAYWASAIGMKLLGPDAAGARIPATMAAVTMLVALACAARRRFAALAGDPPLAIGVLATSVLFFGLARSLASDPFLASGVALFWSCAPSPWALAGIGIGFLAKGPVVLVHTVLPLVVLALIRRNRSPLAQLRPAWGWLLAAAIALPWFVLVIAKVPGLTHYFLVHQTWERFTTTVHQRSGPPWYFMVVLIAGMLPWTPLLIAGIARAIRRLRTRPRDADEIDERDQVELALAWLLVPLVFFSFSGSKLPAYILPGLPAAALLTAYGADSLWARRTCAVLLGALAVAGALFGPMLMARAIALAPGTALPLPVAMWIALATFAIAAIACARGRMASATTLVMIGWAAAVIGMARYEGPLGSPRPAIRLLASQVRPGEPVIEVEAFTAGVPFYLGHPVQLLEVPREQKLDVAAELQAVTVSREALPELVERHGRVWLVGPEETIREVAGEAGLRFTILTHWRKRTIGFLSRGE